MSNQDAAPANNVNRLPQTTPFPPDQMAPAPISMDVLEQAITGNIEPNGNVTSSSVPENVRIVEQNAAELASQANSAVDSTTAHIVEGIDVLIKQLEEMKAHVLKHGEITKVRMGKHINLAPMAEALTEMIRGKVNKILDDADDAAAAVK